MISVPLKRSESSAITFALATATIMIAHQVAGKATRDALFLSYFDVTQLPKAVIAAAILSMLAVFAMSRLLTRQKPGTLVPIIFAVSAVLFLGEWIVFDIDPKLAAIILYLHMAIFGAILISGFWSVVNERFDPHSAKRTIARVAAAATLGGVLGGVIAQRVAALVDVRAMLLVLSALHLACMVGVAGIGGTARPIQEQAKVRSGLQIIAGTPYLQQMGLLMILIALVAALVDYAFKAEASSRFESGEELITFFATFYAAAGVVTFVVQTVLGPRMLYRFGIGTTIAILPAAVFVGGIVSAAVTQVWTMVLLRGSHSVFANSFYRSAFELLYTPLPPERKRPTKTIIDVATDRVGDMLGGGLVLLLLALMTDLPSFVVICFAVLAAGAALYVVSRLHRGYVGQLARNLRKGSVSLAEDEVVDATTQHILAETTVFTERELLMARIKEHRAARSANPPQLDTEVDTGELSDDEVKAIETKSPRLIPNTARMPSKSERFAGAVADLTSGDIAHIRHALRDDFMDMRLTPYLIPLLGNDKVASDARMELRWLVPRIIGQLTDALLDPELPLLVRQRLPGVLEVCHNHRAIHGLIQGLVDEEFNVRYSCARALTRMRSRNAELKIPEDVVFKAVQREVAVEAEVWEGRALKIDTTLPLDGPVDAPALPKANRSLEHVFTVLSLVLDRDALHLALLAVYSTDRNLRGTALEYLENVLPDDIRRSLWRHIGVTRRRTPKTSRSRRTLVTELKQTAGAPTK